MYDGRGVFIRVTKHIPRVFLQSAFHLFNMCHICLYSSRCKPYSQSKKMKKSDVYEITIKILGIYLLVADISKLPGLLTFLRGHGSEINAEQGIEQVNLLWINGLSFALLLILAVFLIAKTKFITRLVTNVSDQQENVKLFADRKVIYEIALVIIGGLLIVNSLPDLMYRLYNLSTVGDQRDVVSSCARIFIGIITVAYGKRIAAYFAK